MSSNIVSFEENQPHVVREVICVKCLKRAINVAPVGVWLKDLECETCGPGFIIMTGQEIEQL